MDPATAPSIFSAIFIIQAKVGPWAGSEQLGFMENPVEKNSGKTNKSVSISDTNSSMKFVLWMGSSQTGTV